MRPIWAVPLLSILILTGGISSVTAEGPRRASSDRAIASPGGYGMGRHAAATNGGGQITYIGLTPGPNGFAIPTGIWLMNDNGTEPHELVADNEPPAKRRPDEMRVLGWTPDGSKMVFASPSGISEINADGSGRHTIPQLNDPTRFPLGVWSLSPDGSQVAFDCCNHPTDGLSLFIAGIGDVSNPLKLFWYGVDNAGTAQAEWTPNEKYLIVSVTPNGPGLLSIPTDGSGVDGQGITGISMTIDGVQQSIASFSISSDGSKIVFNPYQGSNSNELYTVPISGGAATPVPGAPTNAGANNPQWSLDGNMIAFDAYSGNTLFTIPSAGGTPTDLGVSGIPQAWRPHTSVKLSGTLWTTDCTNKSCSRAGTVGDKLAVSGKDSGGKRVSTSATSGAGGRWFANVPSGTYTITPAAGFVPESKTVEAAGSVAGIDFATCGVLGSPASHGGARTQKSRSRPDVATGEKGCPDGIDWKLPERTADVPDIAKGSHLGMLGQKDIYAPFM